MGHEDSIVSTFLAWGIIVLALYHFYKGYTSGEKIDLDNMQLFTITDIEEPVIEETVQYASKHKKTKKQKKKKKKKKKQQPQPPQQQRNSRGYTQLQQDCFDALKSLGIKAVRERDYIISSTFNKHNPKTIQEFLQLALGK